MFSASLIGHSMGGKVAMQLALDHPDMVEKLIVVDMEPGPADDNHSGIFEALLSMDLDAMTDRTQIDAFLLERIPDFGTRQFLLKNITREEDGRFAWKMNLPVLWKHFPDVLAEVRGPHPFEKPTLFVRGGNSNYIKDEDWAHTKTLFPNAELVTIPGAGHWVHADKPKELLEVLKGFL
jgi:pimeloyl-ACP methyl ester carboxylesterase